MIRKLAVLCAMLLGALGAHAADTQDLVERGKYVFGSAGGCACHTPPDAVGLNAGGRKFARPFGVVYSRNITPDPDTGIGRWTDTQIVNAIRRGDRPDGTRLFPIHPYPVFSRIADDEAYALAAYLKSVKPVVARTPERALNGPVPAVPVADAPARAPQSGVERGKYLVNGAAHCVDCHTPRRAGGSFDDSKFLAGGPGPEDTVAPNITPDPATGIGRWSEAQIADFLRGGPKPSGQHATSLMRVVIVGTSAGYKDLTPGDALAIAQYLKTLPPIVNKVAPR